MSSTLVLTNFLLLDPRREALVPGLELKVVDGEIAELGARVGREHGAQVIDAGQLTLMPGLIDAHVHVFMNERNIGSLREVPQTYATAKAIYVMQGMLMRGFTTIRDVAGGDYGLRDAISERFLEAPRLFTGGRAISQTGGHGDFRSRAEQSYECNCCSGLSLFSRIADGIPEVLKAVREELRLGADHIKLMLSGGVASPNDPLESLQFRSDEILAAVDEAARWGAYVCAHAYSDKAVRRAVDLGVRTIEHGNFLSRETAHAMAEKGAFLIPTLIVYHVNKILGAESGKSPSSLLKNDKVLAAGFDALKYCREAGVPIGFGTDLSMTTQRYQCEGLALQAQFMSNAEVIRSATVVNADVLRKAGRLGEIVIGARADVLVVNGDPYQDLKIFDDSGSNIKLIMKDGIIFKNALAC